MLGCGGRESQEEGGDGGGNDDVESGDGDRGRGGGATGISSVEEEIDVGKLGKKQWHQLNILWEGGGSDGGVKCAGR